MDEEKNVNPNDEKEVKAAEVKTADKAKNKGAKSNWFHTKAGEFKGEFGKIIWPSRKDLVKETVTVIITSLIFGVVITGLDTVFQLAYEFLVRLTGNML